MSEQIRLQILSVLIKQHKSGAEIILEDKDLSQEINYPLQEIQDQLDILEKQGYVKLTKGFGLSYTATISPEGILYLEQIVQQYSEEKPKKPMGFIKE